MEPGELQAKGPKKTNTQFETLPQKEMRQRLIERTVLICPKNDAESLVILKLAKHLGLTTLESSQPRGANLAYEPELQPRLEGVAKLDVWIVEIPGVTQEAELTQAGRQVRVIDHHWYQGLDRTADPETQKRLPSSLEQFLTATGISDEELMKWGFVPRLVHGVGILDAQFIEGLRQAGYVSSEIKQVLNYARQLNAEIDPAAEETMQEAEKVWVKKEKRGQLWIVTSDASQDVRTQVALCAVQDEQDTEPWAVSFMSGKKLYVYNLPVDTVNKLKQSVQAEAGQTFSFGKGDCFGVDNTKGSRGISLEEFINHITYAG